MNVATLLRTIDVADRLDLTPERIRQLVADGKLHPVLTGPPLHLFDPDEVDRLAAERERERQERRARRHRRQAPAGVSTSEGETT